MQNLPRNNPRLATWSKMTISLAFHTKQPREHIDPIHKSQMGRWYFVPLSTVYCLQPIYLSKEKRNIRRSTTNNKLEAQRDKVSSHLIPLYWTRSSQPLLSKHRLYKSTFEIRKTPNRLTGSPTAFNIWKLLTTLSRQLHKLRLQETIFLTDFCTITEL